MSAQMVTYSDAGADQGTAAVQDASPAEIRLRIHGVPRRGEPDLVLGDVFARKLASLIKALKAADAAANGETKHEYRITDLRVASASVGLVERPVVSYLAAQSRSGRCALQQYLETIRGGGNEPPDLWRRTSTHLLNLTKGASRQFGYGELWLNGSEPVRLDEFLADRVKATLIVDDAAEPKPTRYRRFSGIALGSFEGTIKEVDLRGALPQIKLVLSAGQVELDCICGDKDIDLIRAALDRRVRVAGRAFYDGKGGLPRRVEVTEIQHVKEGKDFTRWRGAFDAFAPDDWPERDVS